ncbi:MAG: hypothetical protein ACP5HM_16050 [Anaerolineae bacterium]
MSLPRGGLGIVKQQCPCRRLLLAVDACPVYSKGEASHEQRLPDGLLQHHCASDTRCCRWSGSTEPAGLAHQRGNVAVGG